MNIKVIRVEYALKLQKEYEYYSLQISYTDISMRKKARKTEIKQ